VAPPLKVTDCSQITDGSAALVLVSGKYLQKHGIDKAKLPRLLGYGLAALTKPLFPLATTPAWVVTARLLDRVGKGIRGAPRDALVGKRERGKPRQ